MSEAAGTGEQIVYRSRSGAVVAAMSAYRAEWRAYQEAIGAALKEAGASGYEVLGPVLAFRPGEFRGIRVPAGQDEPDGWRRSMVGQVVPDGRTPIGRRMIGRLREVQHPGDPVERLPGMPTRVLYRGGCVVPGVRGLEAGEAVYVVWSIDPAESARVDPAVWERVAVREYLKAVKEAAAEEAARGVMRGAERVCPEGRTPVALATLQFAAGGLLDARPVDGYAVHLVRVAAGGGTPGPTLCGIDRFARGSAGWSVRGGVTGPGIVHRPCPGCLEAACTTFGCLPIERRGIGVKEMTEARASCVRETLMSGDGVGMPAVWAEWLAEHKLGGDLGLAKAIVAEVAERKDVLS